MDEFEALLATKAPPKGAPRAPAVDEFDALLTSTKPTRTAAVPEKTLAPEGHLEGWVKPAAKKLVGAGADLVDLVFTGLLAPPVAAAGQLTTMIQGELNDGLGIKKSTRRERAQAGLETAGRINKALGTPVRSLLTSLGYLSADDAPVEEAMGKVMGLVERDAAAVEERTGGRVLKEDVLGAVNVLFGGLGAKGTQIAGKKIVDVKAAKAATKALEDLKAERAGENLAAEEAAAATKQTADEAAATAAAQDGALKSANLKPDYPARAGTQQRYADPNQLRLPADDALGGVDPTLALAAAKARKARRSEVRAAFTEDPNYADFSEGQAALADRIRDGTQTPPVPGSPTRLDGPDYSVGMAPRRSTEAISLEADPVRGVAEAQDLSSALTKVSSGREFDLTAVEKIALRDSALVTEPKIDLNTGVVKPSSAEGAATGTAKGRIQQAGVASQDLLEKVAVIGGAGALASYLSSDESRITNAGAAAIVAGLALFARSRSPQVADWASQAGRGAEYALGLVSTRVKDLSPALLRRMRDHEMAVLKATHENLSAVAPFVEGLRKVPADLRDRLNRAVLSGESGEVIRLLGQTGNPELVSQWRTVRKTLDTLGNDLVTTGKLKGLLTDYYPRVVIDAKGLLEALGKEERSYLQTKIDEATHAAARQSRDLSPLEVSQIINKYLKGRGPTSGKPGFLKKRSVDEVTDELAPFYAPASESLPLYVRAVSKELERARFFGDDLVRKDGIANLDLSIGGLVERERALRKLDDTQVEELRSILTSRFGPGERASAGALQTAKNLTNAGLLGHATSAFVQLGDVLVSTYAHGILPTIKGLQQVTMRDPARITVRDLGMIDHISEEIVSPSRQPIVIGGMTLSSAKFLDGVFKYSGFSLVDQLGKNVSIAAAADKYAKAMQSPAGVSKFKEKYKDAYSPAELDQAVADFRSRENTDLTRSVLFSELSDVQPISKLEVPQGYLDMPNGRIVYMLKTFMLKQADIVRRDAIQEFKRGNYAKGASNLLQYSIALGIGGATTDFVRNWLLGKEQRADWGSLPDNVLKTFGMSQYVIEKARRGEPVAAIGQTALPPYKMWEHILTTEPEAIQYIPLAGKFLYMHGMGGAEKANASAEKRRAAAERKAEGLGKEKEE